MKRVLSRLLPLALLALSGCGRTITAPAMPPEVCVKVDTLWKGSDTPVIMKTWFSGDNCNAP